jgi:hypothetical protein
MANKLEVYKNITIWIAWSEYVDNYQYLLQFGDSIHLLLELDCE